MICGALQTLNEEALEDVLQSEPPPPAGELPSPHPAPPPPAHHIVHFGEDMLM